MYNLVIFVYLTLILAWGASLVLLPDMRFILYIFGGIIFFSSFFIVMNDSKSAFPKVENQKK